MKFKIKTPVFYADHGDRHKAWRCNTPVAILNYGRDTEGVCYWFINGRAEDVATLKEAKAACIAAYEKEVRNHPVVKLIEGVDS